MSYRRRSRYNYGRSYGYGAARNHISAAAQLSADVGGTDKFVKEYFFSMSWRELAPVLDDYERSYGRAARNYAEQAIPKWKAGKVKMGGQTVERLFNLLPGRMPLPVKYKLTETLWEHFGPASRKRLRFGLDANIDAILEEVRAHIDSVVSEYKIPENLERRFFWISSGDVSVKQDLLNYVRTAQKSLVIEAARLQVPIMLQHLSSPAGQNTQRMAQTLKVGKHELELLPDKKSTGVSLEEPWFRPPTKSGEWGWIWPWLIFIALIWYFASKH